MSSNEIIKRVRIYLNERDQVAGQPLYLAALERLRREGATGATVMRGIAGFGASQRMRTTGAQDFSLTPVLIEWIDRAEHVLRVLPALDELLPDALITIEDVRVYRAVLRASGPFGDRTAGQVMLPEPATGQLGTPVRAAAELLLERDQRLLPVLDERGGVVGVLSDGDLMRRGGLLLPLRLWPALNDAERAALLDRLPARTVGELMTSEPRTIYIEASIPQAINPLIEWGVSALPVLDREGRLAGLFGVDQALQAAQRDQTGAETVRDAEPPVSVGLVMQRAAPSIGAAAPLSAVMQALIGAPDHFLVVVDANQPIGTLSDLALIEQLEEPVRSIWLAALRAPDAPLAALPAGADAAGAAAQLASTDAPTVSTQTSQDQALQLMLSGKHERLVVADDEGRLAGLLARRGLLRALVQAAG